MTQDETEQEGLTRLLVPVFETIFSTAKIKRVLRSAQSIQEELNLLRARAEDEELRAWAERNIRKPVLLAPGMGFRYDPPPEIRKRQTDRRWLHTENRSRVKFTRSRVKRWGRK